MTNFCKNQTKLKIISSTTMKTKKICHLPCLEEIYGSKFKNFRLGSLYSTCTLSMKLTKKICRVKPKIEYLWNCRMSFFNVRQTKMHTWMNIRGRGQEWDSYFVQSKYFGVV
jgi:hypothetical protein